ncbi:hypothetical protein KUV62_14915 [Salipiger bermudensis]|uniref:spike base protein, RCAP_Rcc01079 family n=1 Tax=Salipiger bermudensis TaxID=344736 RepID=UPI001C994620|nr:hypothetical protein [Salipiger bermudensis]MBY6005213.1 hypothetical protein [Salipiger bermudensis]
MSDRFGDHSSGLTAPATDVLAITPDDGTDLASIPRALNVATGGIVRVTTLDGTVASVHVSAGIAFPLRCRRVWATGTSATGIAGLI